MLPVIHSSDLGCPATPGDYDFGGATVRVEEKHIDAWQREPLVPFRAVLCTRAGDKSTRFALGQPVSN